MKCENCSEENPICENCDLDCELGDEIICMHIVDLHFHADCFENVSAKVVE